jgi:1,4-alpha-glucan branching enzyme
MAKSDILKILKIDPYLMPFKDDLDLRMSLYKQKRKELLGKTKIVDFADGYKYFGFHRTENGWVY